MLKIMLTALVTAAISFAVAAATSFAHQDRGQRYVTARIGDFLVIPAVDLSCSIFRRDPDRHEAGALMYCGRQSTQGNSRTVSISPR